MAVTKFMKSLLGLLLIVPAAADVSPRPADESGWRLRLAPIEKPWAYVDTGGRGEYLMLRFHLVSPRRDWAGLGHETLKFRVVARAKGLPESTTKGSSWKDGLKPVDSGVEAGLWAHLSLAALEAQWGLVPDKITVSAALEEDGAPTVTSPAMAIPLQSVPRRDATWEQRVRTLQVGQSRLEVLEMLGPALKEIPFQGVNGGWESRLVYPNPDASKDLPEILRETHIYLDARGRLNFAQLHGGC